MRKILEEEDCIEEDSREGWGVVINRRHEDPLNPCLGGAGGVSLWSLLHDHSLGTLTLSNIVGKHTQHP